MYNERHIHHYHVALLLLKRQMLVRHYTPVCSAGSIKIYTVTTPMYKVSNVEVMLKLCKIITTQGCHSL